MSDPISDFLNKLKIASQTGKESFTFPYSGVIAAIAGALEKKGYVASSRKTKKGRELEVTFPVSEKAHPITGAKRVSLLSKRMYKKAREIRPVRNGSGTAILSTPKGVLSDSDARAAKVGGEVLFEIW
ncbi:MAG: 30S ribosomal protein S8 [Parcubacteria group bacterium GW2011_GWA2_49_9]|nr:MAG: 30S ribosomal protein S8 [Parcubacteria group bacterium GW2011_GWA2_49_9]